MSILQVEDQMKLLQNCWSEILILDLAHRLVRQIWSGELILVSIASLPTVVTLVSFPFGRLCGVSTLVIGCGQ